MKKRLVTTIAIFAMSSLMSVGAFSAESLKRADLDDIACETEVTADAYDDDEDMTANNGGSGGGGGGKPEHFKTATGDEKCSDDVPGTGMAGLDEAIAAGDLSFYIGKGKPFDVTKKGGIGN